MFSPVSEPIFSFQYKDELEENKNYRMNKE